MFGRCVRESGLIRALAAVAVLGLIAGCPDKKPPVERLKPELTVDEQVEAKVAEAEEALKADDLVKAAELADEADKLKPGSAKDVRAKIQTAKDTKAAADREKEIQTALRKARDLLAQGDKPGAKREAQKVLALDPANAEALEIIAKAEAPVVAPKKEEYDAINAQIDAALRAGQSRKAIDLIGKLEAVVDEAAGLKSRKAEILPLEAKILVAEADVATRNGRWEQAIAKLKEAKAKTNTADIRRRLADAERKKRADDDKDAKNRRYRDAMRRGDRAVAAGNHEEARRQYQTAERNATDGRSRRRVRDKIAEVGRKIEYKKNLSAGDQAMFRGDIDEAVQYYRKAQAVVATPEVARKLDDADAAKAEADGDKAAAAGDWATALAEYERANSLVPTAERAGKAEKARGEKEHVDYLAKIASCEAARKALNFTPVVPDLEALKAKYPDWKEAGALLKAGPLKKEVDRINAAATKEWKILDAKLKKLGKNHASKIAAIEAALPKLLYSKHEKTARSNLKREKDAVLQGQFTKVKAGAAKLKGQRKIDYLTQQLPTFKGSGHYDKIAKDIKTERTSMKTKPFNALKAAVTKMKTPAEKIRALEARKAEFAGTTYEKQIASMISAQLNILKKADFTKLMAALKKLKKPDAKIAELKRSRPNFKGTRYEASITKQLYKAVLAKWKGEKDPKRKIAILEAELGGFAGTKLERKIKGLINKGKAGLEAAVFKTVSAAAAKLKGQKKLDYLNSKQGEFKSKTYVGKIKRLIDAAKKTLKADAKRAADAAAKKVYDGVMKKVKKSKDKAANVQMLTEALGKVAATKYAGMIRKEITKNQPKPAPAPRKKGK